jgi:hypothetical protein
MAEDELRDFRDHFGSSRNPSEWYPRDLQQYPDTECRGCPRGFVYDEKKGRCIPYVMQDMSTWRGSVQSGCAPGWRSRRIDLVSGKLLPGDAPWHREREGTVCVPLVSTNFGRRPNPSNP